MPEITPNLWFDTEAEQAAEYYVAIFPNSRIMTVTHYNEAGPREAGMVLTVEFELDGSASSPSTAARSSRFDEAVSLSRSSATTRPRSTTTGSPSPTAARRGRAAG